METNYVTIISCFRSLLKITKDSTCVFSSDEVK